jgi:hypothetical protein
VIPTWPHWRREFESIGVGSAVVEAMTETPAPRPITAHGIVAREAQRQRRERENAERAAYAREQYRAIVGGAVDARIRTSRPIADIVSEVIEERAQAGNAVPAAIADAAVAEAEQEDRELGRGPKLPYWRERMVELGLGDDLVRHMTGLDREAA